MEIDNRKNEIVCLRKCVKEKDKDLYRVQRKCENLEDTVKRCRTEIASLKRENKNLVKREVSEHREKGKTSSKSSLTLAETPSIVSTVNTNSKSLPDTSWPQSPINNNSRHMSHVQRILLHILPLAHLQPLHLQLHIPQNHQKLYYTRNQILR